MQISHLGHAAVLLQTEGARVLIDPGNLSTGWHGLTDLDAILVTHQHPDHLDPENIGGLLAANPSANVFVEPSILGLVADGTLPSLGAASALAPEEQTAVGDLLITAVGGEHAEIYREIPRIANVGYVVRSEGQPTFYHPGDEYDTAPGGVDILAVPASAPWCALKDTLDFVRSVGALECFPIHDELLSDTGRGMFFGRIDAMTNSRLVNLRGGSTHTF